MISRDPEHVTAPPSVFSEDAESWPTQNLGSEGSPLRAKDEGKWAKTDVNSMLIEKANPSSLPRRNNASDAKGAVIVPSAGGKFSLILFKNDELKKI